MTRSCIAQGRRLRQGQSPRGFTLVELLVVMVILAVLIALLLPAINGAIRTSRNAAVSAEINQLAQALASFKSKYGDYPPSRILLIENGDYSAAIQNTNSLSGGNGEITVAQLAQRSLAYLRKFFPRAVFSTSGPVFPLNSGRWYDFNGNGGKGPDTPYILEGHQCLVFFLGGIPNENPLGSGNYSVTGFGKDPTNPFSNNFFVDPNFGTGTGPSPMYSANRTAPLFEFNSARLATDPLNPYSGPPLNLISPQIPGYLDSLGNARPDGAPNDPVNFYAYFSAYGSGGYDPNDVNFSSETDSAMQIPGLSFRVGFPIFGGGLCGSPAPNPYTSTVTVPPTGVISFINPQSFQIISSGLDGLYGVGGQYLPDSTNATLPLDSSNNYGSYLNTSDHSIRTRERDNLTNFHNGRLE